MKNDVEIEIDNHWPTPIWRARVEELNNENLIRFILDEQITTPKSIQRSNNGGWHSRQNLYEDTVMSELCGTIRNMCNELLPVIKGIRFRQMWAMINKKNDWNAIHQHGKYEISGGYYLRVPEDSGRIVFQNPCPLRENYIINQFVGGGNSKGYKPKEHELMMWPAYLNHYVEPSRSDVDRIMISFDLDINVQGEKYGK